MEQRNFKEQIAESHQTHTTHVVLVSLIWWIDLILVDMFKLQAMLQD